MGAGMLSLTKRGPRTPGRPRRVRRWIQPPDSGTEGLGTSLLCWMGAPSPRLVCPAGWGNAGG